MSVIGADEEWGQSDLMNGWRRGDLIENFGQRDNQFGCGGERMPTDYDAVRMLVTMQITLLPFKSIV